jgi:beta-glucanase (GH16 family)
MVLSRLSAGLLALFVVVLGACGGGGGGGGTSPDASHGAISVLSLTNANSVTSADATATSLVPLAPVATYPVSPLELILNGDFSNQMYFWGLADPQTRGVPSEIRAGGQGLFVNSWAGQKFDATTLEAGKAYTLTVVARKIADGGIANMSVVFHDRNNVLYRLFNKVISSTGYDTYTLSFTAPAYVAMAEASFSVSDGAQLLVDTVSLKMREPIIQTEPVLSLAGSYVPAGYGLAFNDEFNGPTLNRDKWFTRYIYEGATRDHMADEQERYRDNDNHVISSDGILSLVARQVSTNDPQGANYESGMIRSDWTTLYGYIEARVKMPGAVGVFPAFWLTPDASDTGSIVWPPEIDIFEFVNNGVEDLLNMLHTGVVSVPGASSAFLYADPAFSTQWTFWWAPFNFNDGWHTVGAEWTPTSVTTYVDGQKIVTRSYEWKDQNGQLAGPAHILLNLAVGGSWAGRHGIDAASFPQALQIDWVRAYKKLD